jgi:16S rRNA (cytidine1402-2'-O)-methyltransferase
LKLLRHYQIEKPLVSLHEHNERAKTPQIIEQIKSGKSVALVSDGGTPLVSDPGWWLVHCSIEEKIPVVWIPGACALVGGLILSGLPAEGFIFEGFLPTKSAARKRRLESVKNEKRSIIFYESPHRLLKLLKEIDEVLGDVSLSCARELTKMFEEVKRGKASELVSHFEKHPPKGEFVVVLNNRRCEPSAIS